MDRVFMEPGAGADNRVILDLKKSEKEFRRLFEDCPLGLVMLDRDMRVTRVNRAFTSILGYGEDELRGRPVIELTAPSDHDVAEQLIARAHQSSRQSHQVTKRYRHKDGHVVVGRVTALAIRDDDGHPLYALGIVEDLTEQVQVADSLQVAQEAEVASRIEQARLEGVLLAAHLTADRLGNALSLTRGYHELVLEQFDLPPRAQEMLNESIYGLQLAIDHLHELQNIVRVATRDTPLGPMLDVEKSTRRDVVSQPEQVRTAATEASIP